MTRTLTLPAVMDLKAAAPLREALLALRGQAVTLDASAVDRLGGLCLQVLLAARKTWAADGVELRLAAVPEAVVEQLAGFGAADLGASVKGTGG